MSLKHDKLKPLGMKGKAKSKLTRPVRALSASVSFPRSSGTCSGSVSDTGSMFCRLVFVVSPLGIMQRPEVSLIRRCFEYRASSRCLSKTSYVVHIPNELLLGQISGERHEIDHAESSIGSSGTGYGRNTAIIHFWSDVCNVSAH